jgi:hypothetical protein
LSPKDKLEISNPSDRDREDNCKHSSTFSKITNQWGKNPIDQQTKILLEKELEMTICRLRMTKKNMKRSWT